MSFGRVVLGVILVIAGVVLGIHLAFTYPKTTTWWLKTLGCTSEWCNPLYAGRRHPYDQTFEEGVYWLALNMYYHRGETNTMIGRKAVTAVVLNRMMDQSHYFGPRTIKGIITFGYVGCQCTCSFTWYCDGKDDKPDDPVRFLNDRDLARRWLEQFYEGSFRDPTGGATWFHYRGGKYPEGWPDELEKAGAYGEYAFYRYP